MGRKRKYFSDEEKQKAANKYAVKYYLRNREKIKRKNRERYHQNKTEILNEKKE